MRIYLVTFSIKLTLLILLVVTLSYCSDNQMSKSNKVINATKLELKEPLIIKEDFSIDYIKIGLKYSDFNKINKTSFNKSNFGGVACGDTPGFSPLWSSTISLINDSIGLKIEFSSTWEENAAEKEEVLDKILLSKTGSKFYNGIVIGKSSPDDIKSKFGKPKRETDYFLEYIFTNKYINFGFNQNNILQFITIRTAYNTYLH